MEGLIVVLLAGVAGFALLLNRGKSLKFQAALNRISVGWDAQVSSAGLFRTPKLVASVQGVGLAIRVEDDGDGQRQTRIEASVTLPGSLTIGEEGRVSGLRRFLGGGDTEIGIEAFDRQFLLKASEDVHVITRMGARTRRAVSVAVGDQGVRLRNGKLQWSKSGTVTDDRVSPPAARS